MRKISVSRAMYLQDFFNRKIECWCRENNYSLHEAFEVSRKEKSEYYIILSELWSTYFGREYLRSVFRYNGGRLRKKKRTSYDENSSDR